MTQNRWHPDTAFRATLPDFVNLIIAIERDHKLKLIVLGMTPE